MAPEQFSGEAHLLDGRADVWALGVVLYELLTGKRPFPAQSFEGLKEEVLKRDPRPLRQLNPKLPSWTEAIVAKCLAKNSSDRYGTAADLAMDLRRGQVGYSERRRGRRALLAFGLVLLVALTAGGYAAAQLLDLSWPWNSNESQAKNSNGASDTELDPSDAHTPVVPVVPKKETWLPAGQGIAAAPGAELLELSPGSNTFAPSRIIKTVVRPDGSKVEVPFLLIQRRKRNDPPAFYIMETKVWNELFAVFRSSTSGGSRRLSGRRAQKPDGEWLGVEGEAARYPVFNVRLAEAVRFATWLGGKLPSAEEWDKAAGFNDRPSRGHWSLLQHRVGCNDIAVDRENEGPVPVGSSKDDVSVFGVRDVAGNGWEFTRTSFGDPDMPPVEEFENDYNVVRSCNAAAAMRKTEPLTFEAMQRTAAWTDHGSQLDQLPSRPRAA